MSVGACGKTKQHNILEPPRTERRERRSSFDGEGGANQRRALVVLRVNGAAARQDEEALLRTHDLRDSEAGQGFAVDWTVHVGVELPAQEPPSDHFLQASLEGKKSRRGKKSERGVKRQRIRIR